MICGNHSRNIYKPLPHTDIGPNWIFNFSYFTTAMSLQNGPSSKLSLDDLTTVIRNT